jgi:glycosyltransferase involved in cell wall biosynthesis
MKIQLAVNGTFLMKPVTGVQRYAIEMIRGLQQVGFRDLKIISPPGYLGNEFLGYEVMRDPLKINWKNQWWMWEQFRLPRLLKALNNCILWSPCNIGPLSVQNQIVTMHDAAVFFGSEWFSTAGGTYYRWIMPKLGKKAKHIFTVSQFSKNELIRYKIATEEKISVVYNGVSNIFLDYQKSALFENVDQKYVITIGSRDPRKNISTLIDAWTRLDPALKKDLNLVIIGGKNRGFADEKLVINSNDIQLVGYLPDDEMINFMRKAILFVYPSLYEGFGLPPLEAMALGVPVLCSNTTSIPEICGNAAEYCDPTSVSDIAEKLASLLTDKHRRIQLSKLGLEHVKKYSWQHSAREFVEQLKKIQHSGG